MADTTVALHPCPSFSLHRYCGHRLAGTNTLSPTVGLAVSGVVPRWGVARRADAAVGSARRGGENWSGGGAERVESPLSSPEAAAAYARCGSRPAEICCMSSAYRSHPATAAMFALWMLSTRTPAACAMSRSCSAVPMRL